MPYWEITPHENKEYDCCVLPADTEADHHEGLRVVDGVIHNDLTHLPAYGARKE